MVWKHYNCKCKGKDQNCLICDKKGWVSPPEGPHMKNITVCYWCGGIGERYNIRNVWGECNMCDGNGYHPWKCGNCWDKLSEEEIEDPYEDKNNLGGGNPICHYCFVTNYYFTCVYCENYAFQSDAWQIVEGKVKSVVEPNNYDEEDMPLCGECSKKVIESIVVSTLEGTHYKPYSFVNKFDKRVVKIGCKVMTCEEWFEMTWEKALYMGAVPKDIPNYFKIIKELDQCT